MGRATALTRDTAEGLEWFDRAINFTPNHAWAYTGSATIRAFTRPSLAIEHGTFALSLSPQDPYRHSMCAALAVAHNQKGEVEQAAQWGREAMRNPHKDLMVMITAMATNFIAGEKDAAKTVADRIRTTHPNVSSEGIARGNPMMNDQQKMVMAAALKANGFN